MPSAKRPKNKPTRKAAPVKKRPAKRVQSARAKQAAKRSAAAKKGWETRRSTDAVKVGVQQRRLQTALFELEQARARAANARGLPEHGILREEQRALWVRWRRLKKTAKRELSPNGKPTMSQAFEEVLRRIGRKLGLRRSLIESYVTS